jgi:hypothetical protein
VISINLVPNIKQELLRAQSQRTSVISMAITIGIVIIGIVVALGVIVGAQILYSSQLDDTIKTEGAELLSTPDLTNMLTIQNQLQKIDEIDTEKSIDSRLFDILVATNPSEPNTINISGVTLNPTDKVIIITGQTTSGYSALEVFTKTITATKVTYSQEDRNTEVNLTDNVTIDQQGFGENAEGQRVLTFTLSFTYPVEIFAGTSKDAVIIGPNTSQNVTDSYIRVPESLFVNPAQTPEGTGD